MNQAETKQHPSGSDLAPMVVLAVFIVLFLGFLPEWRHWLLGLIVFAVLARLAYAYFRRRG